ncbi:MAG: DUF4227 family protein [Kyrpidia sp.]|nr:DUF4227 family protein [Kyrpidia sp.]
MQVDHRPTRRRDSLWYVGTAVALAFLLFQGWLLWNEQHQARDPYREPRGPAVKVHGPGETDFSWETVWQRLQEFYRAGE